MEDRAYQWDLFQIAKKTNTIAYLDTGSGKTFIAVLLVKEKQHQLGEVESEPSADMFSKRKWTIFLAPKVPLVLQQAEVLEEHTSLKIGAFYGEMGVDKWKKGIWQKELAKHQV
jgi:endoribonuclease Dicer